MHGKISSWEPCHHERRSCKKQERPTRAWFPYHQEQKLLCTRVRYLPLTAGSTLSFCEIGGQLLLWCSQQTEHHVSQRKPKLACYPWSLRGSGPCGRMDCNIPINPVLHLHAVGHEAQLLLIFFYFSPRLLWCTRSKTAGITAHDNADEQRCAMQSLQLWGRSVSANSSTLPVLGWSRRKLIHCSGPGDMEVLVISLHGRG